MKGSYFDESGGGENQKLSGGQELTHDMNDLISRKVDKADFREFSYTTLSKREHEHTIN